MSFLLSGTYISLIVAGKYYADCAECEPSDLAKAMIQKIPFIVKLPFVDP